MFSVCSFFEKNVILHRCYFTNSDVCKIMNIDSSKLRALIQYPCHRSWTYYHLRGSYQYKLENNYLCKDCDSCDSNQCVSTRTVGGPRLQDPHNRNFIHPSGLRDLAEEVLRAPRELVTALGQQVQRPRLLLRQRLPVHLRGRSTC